MSQKSTPFTALVAFLFSVSAPVWSGSPSPAENRSNTAEGPRIDHYRSSPGKWRNASEADLTALLQNRLLIASRYLAQNAPEKTKPAAEVAESVEVSIKEWLVPTSGSRPHDPLATPDGFIWYTGQMANLLGRLDPRTGEFKEYRLRTPESGPHALVADKDGNIWFTASFKGYIGKLDPKTGKISEYPMPDPKARDPHKGTYFEGLTELKDAKRILRSEIKSGKVGLSEGQTLHDLMKLVTDVYNEYSYACTCLECDEKCGPD